MLERMATLNEVCVDNDLPTKSAVLRYAESHPD